MINEADLKKLLDQNEAIVKAVAGMNNGVDTLAKRLDSVEKTYEEHRKAETLRRIDSFQFSKRKDKEPERAYQSRHDDEERTLRADLMRVATGEDKETVADKARKARRDAEEKEEEEQRRDKRKDDDDDRKDDDRKDQTKPSIMSKKDEDEDDKRKDDDDDKRKDDDDDKRKDDDDRKDEDDRKDDDDDRKDAKEEDKEEKADAIPPQFKKDDDKRKDARKADSRRDSATVADLKKQVEKLQAGMKPLSDVDLVNVGKLAKRCDSIYTALGESMPRLMPGESLVDYHRKLAADLKKHTKYKDSELAVIAADSNTFDLVTEEIFKQAEDFAKSPARYKPGELVQRVERMDSGHTRYTYEGSSSVWMSQFAGPVQNHAKKFLTKEDK